MVDKLISFNEFCEICQSMQECSKFGDKEDVLNKFIDKYKSKKASLNVPNITFYPFLRLLIPEYERERPPYGLKETSFSKLFVKTLCLQGSDANTLKNYNKMSTNAKNKDFADTAYHILRKWCPKTSTLTVADINYHLDQMAKNHMEHQPREVEKELSKLIKSSTAIEQKWMIRLILKSMKLGIGNDRILRIFHPDAADFYDVCSNLSKVCETLHDSKIRLHELDIEIFTPFRPMLSLQCNSDELNKVFKQNKLYFVENKYDGERFQLHMENGQYKYFSKNGYEYSNIYGNNYNSGLITPRLQNIFSKISSVILDGEMMGFNTRTNNFGSKGMNFDVKNLKADSVHRPCYCVFDILYLNGKTITNKPLSERVCILDNLFEPIKGVIEKSPRVEVNTKEEITAELNKSADRKEEGICFKDPNSVYKPNNRKAGWWKMKLEYFEGLMTELDVIILGGYYGDGRRSGKISSFLLGVAVDPENVGESPKKFLTFGKVASGFSVEELDTLLSKLNEFWVPFEEDNNPEGILWKKEKPDFWIDPRKSCILQVKASELTRAADFQTDYTFRFPRVDKIRYDKPWYNCLTVSELKNLTKTNKAVVKLDGRHLNESDTDISPSKRPRRSWENVSLNYLLDVDKKSNLLGGKEFCVYSGSFKHSKQDVEIQIQEFGGRVVQFTGVNTMCTLVGDITPKVKSILKDSARDIVKLDWIIKIIATGDASLTLTPDDMYIISSKTKIMLSKQFDKYGDSHTKCLSKKGLQRIMEKMASNNLGQLLPAEFQKIDNDISFKNPLGLFRPYFIFFDETTSLTDNIKISTTFKQDFAFYGGTTCNEIEFHTTHVVVCGNLCNETIIQRLKEKIREIGNEGVKIVDLKWILTCINSNKIVLEDEFYV